MVAGFKLARIALRFLAGLCLAGALALGLMFYSQYWQWRGCFNEAGRCFIPDSGVVLSDGNFIWGLFAVGALVLALGFWMWSRRLAE